MRSVLRLLSQLLFCAQTRGVCRLCQLRQPSRTTKVALCVAGHSFCSECASRSLAINNRCPLCRRRQDWSQEDRAAVLHDRIVSPDSHLVRDTLGQASSQLAARASRQSATPSVLDDLPAALLESLWSRDSAGLAWVPDSVTDVISPFAASESQIVIQTLMACIESLDGRPAAWDAQLSELQDIDLQLGSGMQTGQPNLLRLLQDIQGYTARVSADFAEYMRRREDQQRQESVQHEARQRQRRLRQYQQHAESDSIALLIDSMQQMREMLQRF